MYVYGQLTAPNPESRAMRVTPITPTRLMSCSMDKIPKNIKVIKIKWHCKGKNDRKPQPLHTT